MWEGCRGGGDKEAGGGNRLEGFLKLEGPQNAYPYQIGQGFLPRIF